jgi:DNA-binding SARP family transcriptional activator
VNQLSYIAIIIYVFFYAYPVMAQKDTHSGLFFKSHEVIQDQRTSLNLTPKEPIRIKDEFSMEFDILFREGDGFYGYIFKMLANGRTPVDLVSNLASQSENFWLVVGDKAVISLTWADLGGDSYNSWLKIRLNYNPSNQQMTLAINDIERTVRLQEQEKLETFQVVFGSSSVPNMLNSDVCPMTVRGISISDARKQLRFWELGKHAKDHVFDLRHGIRAEVSFPEWEIDRQLYWKKHDRIVVPDILGITSNSTSDTIFLVAKDKVMLYFPQSKSSQVRYYEGGNPYPCVENNLVYNPEDKEIWSYSFDSNTISKLDLRTMQWSASPDTCPEPDLWHHAKFFYSPGKKLKTFGGYGHYTYKSTQWTFDDSKQTRDSTDYSVHIPPRYLAAAGHLNEKEALIFGGYGSPTGKQGINPQYYYDLYKWNLESGGIEKLRDISVEKHPFTPVADLVVSEEGKHFYTLIYKNTNYNTSLRLVKIGIEDNSFVEYQDTIPYNFLDTHSWAGLLHNPLNSTLLAVTRTENVLEIYERSFPPILVSEAIQVKEGNFSGITKIVVALFAGGILLLLVRIFFGKRKQVAIVDVQTVGQETEVPLEEKPIPAPTQPFRDGASINLMGGFQVKGEDGKDITGQFTPTLKQLFLLIYLSGIFDSRGISSERLTELLWGDKSLTSARNNRNVNISKLRLLLEKISPEIQLVNSTSFWKIDLGEHTYSDLKDTLSILDKIRSGSKINPSEIERLLSNTVKGDICPEIQNEWMDQYKTNLSGKILDGLFLLAKAEADEDAIVAIADSILKFDPLNDEAIILKCQTLFNSGKKGLALTAYRLFAKEYQNMLGQTFEMDFNEIVGSDPGKDYVDR